MSDDTSPVTLDLLGRILREIQAEQRQQRTLLLAQVDQGRRLERRMGEMDRRMGDMDRRMGDMDRRIGEIPDELELMLKAELMGRLGYYETRIEHMVDQLTERVTALEDAGEKP